MSASLNPPAKANWQLTTSFVSALIIVALFPYPSPVLNKSLFRLHAPLQSRKLNAPYARTCSSAARTHFETRFSRAQRALLPLYAPNVTQSQNRVFMSSLPHEVGDGLGHRTCLINYELFMAISLRLSYSHRVSTYGSLSKEDHLAVEKLFKWGDNELKRDNILDESCLQVAYVNDSCEVPTQNVVCRRVKPRRRGGLFDQTVIIPDEISDCLLLSGLYAEQQCASLFHSFVSAYSEPNTLFQMRPNRCFREYLYTNFTRTRDWFAHKYWQHAEKEHEALDPARLHIAMHVRRGDFFNYTNRVLVPDATYVDVAGRLRMALDDIVGSPVPLTIHMFSEGVSSKGQRVKDNHDTSKMDKLYMDERGHIRDDTHWQRLFHSHRRWKRRNNVKVETHIATDTITAVRMMIASDFFIGSISGLSMQVVRHMGRALMFLPLHEVELVAEENVVTFDYARHGFESFLQDDQLYAMVSKTVRRNRLGCSIL